MFSVRISQQYEGHSFIVAEKFSKTLFLIWKHGVKISSTTRNLKSTRFLIYKKVTRLFSKQENVYVSIYISFTNTHFQTFELIFSAF